MQTTAFDRYEQRHSPIHRLDPRVKTVVTGLFILGNILLPDGAWLAFAAAWGLVWISSRLARLPVSFILKRSFIVLPFTLAAITVLFSTQGTAVYTFPLFSHTIAITNEGIVRFTSIIIRSWLSVQGAILLTATTRFPDLMHALRHLRAPRLLVAIISFMYRYLFVLADEAARLLRAREARSAAAAANQGGGSILWRAKVAGGMVGQLFIRSFERSERVYNAMLARGYRGQLMTMNPHDLTRQDWAGLGAAIFLLALIQIIGHLIAIA